MAALLPVVEADAEAVKVVAEVVKAACFENCVIARCCTVGCEADCNTGRATGCDDCT